MSSVGASVRIENLSKRYGAVVAVDHITLTIERGRFVTLLGPSGSGKTTTLMMLAGFTIPSSGEIYIDGRAVTLDPPFRRDLGMVFQNYALFPHMTVADNIAFPLKMRKLPNAEIKDRVARTLELVRLPGLGHRLPRQLSGGQQQRVALARTLVYNPRVLLMDEPLGALDRKLRQQMQLEIKRLHEELGITCVYVTHDQEEALVMSDDIVVMYEGRIEQTGAPAEIYEAPANRFVADFVGETNFLDAMVTAVDDGRPLLRTAAGLELRAAAGSPVLVGEAVTLSVRPERIRFDRPEIRGNRLFGQVEQVVFVGESIRYLLRLGTGEPMVLKVPNESGSAAYQVKDAMNVVIRPEDIRLLPHRQ